MEDVDGPRVRRRPASTAVGLTPSVARQDAAGDHRMGIGVVLGQLQAWESFLASSTQETYVSEVVRHSKGRELQTKDIPARFHGEYEEAKRKEWSSWLKYGAV